MAESRLLAFAAAVLSLPFFLLGQQTLGFLGLGLAVSIALYPSNGRRPRIVEEKRVERSAFTLFRKRLTENVSTRVKVLWVHDPSTIEVVDAKRNDDGTLLVGKNSYLYKPPPELPPLTLKIGRKMFRAYMVHRDMQLFYTIPEPPPPEEVEEKAREARLKATTLNPRTLATYIASKSVEKVLRKVQASRGEIIMFFATGMTLAFILEFFILPLLGFKIMILPR